MRSASNKEELQKAVKQLRSQTGLSQQKFGDLFKIAAINIANWEQGITKPPEYVVFMMQEIIELQNRIAFLESKGGQSGA